MYGPKMSSTRKPKVGHQTRPERQSDNNQTPLRQTRLENKRVENAQVQNLNERQ